jgi:hypothetical protein
MQLKLRREYNIEWYRMKIIGHVSSDTNEVCGSLTDRYNLYQAYEKASAKKNPYLAPNARFRELRFGDIGGATKFLESFGPLTLDIGQRLSGRGDVIVDLREFWGLHMRFSLIAMLWESLDNREQLANAIVAIYRRKRELSAYDKFPLGQEFGPPPRSDPRGRYEFPWESRQQRATTWVKSATIDEMRKWALQLILLELNIHTRDQRILWERGWEVSGRKFRTVVWLDSLWSAIWEFSGWDTIGLSWRRCPHCQRFFYPKRHDQFYCTPRQQALWSKRRYAAEQRAHEFKRRDKMEGVSKRRLT